MSKKKDQKKETSRERKIVDKTTDESGLHLKHPPKGAEKMDASFSGTPQKNQQGDSSRYANTSDDEA